ncbi:MAG: hypothetical protein Q7U39_06065 [Nitrospira sp.]|nr:hypothetical protein [Nitrospira sp.]
MALGGAPLVVALRAEVADQLLDTVGRQGMAEEVALNGVASLVAQDVELRLCFDPFGQHAKLQPMGHGDDGNGDRSLFGF